MFEFILKILQETIHLFLEISPYLLIGFFFAGLLHTLLGETYIQKHFSHGGTLASIKATLFGIPLPVCSCGVIPLAESLRRDGASKSSTMAFLVSTPSSGIDSIFATYALLGPLYALFRPLASLVSGIAVGAATHISEKDENKNAEPKISANNRKQKKSFKNVFDYGFKVIPGEIAKWLIIGVLVGGAIAALVPSDFGSKYLQSPFLTYLVILLISVPIYICATGSIPIAASLIAKGVLPGAALALLIAGPATNTVTISFVYKRMGKKITILYVLTIVVISVLMGLLFDLFFTTSSGNLSFVSPGGKFMPEWLKITSAIAMVLVFINAKFDFSKAGYHPE